MPYLFVPIMCMLLTYFQSFVACSVSVHFRSHYTLLAFALRFADVLNSISRALPTVDSPAGVASLEVCDVLL